MQLYKVLYIEDDQEDLERMIRGIDSAKFEIVGEIYGEKALARLGADKQASAFKAVLLDAVELKDPITNLPQVLQGDEIARKIREIKPHLPIFAVSWFRSGSVRAPVNGIYPKVTLFSSPNTFKDLEEALQDAILEMDMVSFYPDDGGGKQWKDRWGPEYTKFRNSPSFYQEEVKISQRANEDYELLEQTKNEIHETYRKYRGTDNLFNVLIARRVIFGTVFDLCKDEKGVPWKEVGEFLGFRFPSGQKANDTEMHEGLRNFMNECGIKWGHIINKGTILQEEEKWLKEEYFLA
jgi:hypothetical protein